MRAVLRGWPRAVRLGLVVGLVAASLVLVSALLVHEGEQARVNEKLYERCLSSVADVADVKACTREFYVRRDGRLAIPDDGVVTAAERRAQTSVTTQRIADPPVTPDAPNGPSAPTAGPAAAIGDAAVAADAVLPAGQAAAGEDVATDATEASSTAPPSDPEPTQASTPTATKPPTAVVPAGGTTDPGTSQGPARPPQAQQPTSPTTQVGKPTTAPSQKPLQD